MPPPPESSPSNGSDGGGMLRRRPRPLLSVRWGNCQRSLQCVKCDKHVGACNSNLGPARLVVQHTQPSSTTTTSSAETQGGKQLPRFQMSAPVTQQPQPHQQPRWLPHPSTIGSKVVWGSDGELCWGAVAALSDSDDFISDDDDGGGNGSSTTDAQQLRNFQVHTALPYLASHVSQILHSEQMQLGRI